MRAAVVSSVIVTSLVTGCGSSRPRAGTGADAALTTPDAAVTTTDAGGVTQTAPSPTCASAGCLRAVTVVGDYDLATLRPLLEPAVQVDNGYSLYTLEYFTSARTALATVAIPYRVDTPAGGWHVVANNHGTSGVEDPCVIAGTISGAGLAGTFGARGLIGVAVDYPGLGTPGVHPYLVADIEGHATLDALRATRVLAAHLGVRLSGRNAVVGLSQGGHATLAAAARHRSHAPELDIRAFAATAPATVWEEDWRVGVAIDGPHVAYHAMMVYAWAEHYGFQLEPLWTTQTATIIDEVMAQSCGYPLTAGGPTIASRLGSSAAGIFSPAFLTAYTSGSWGAYARFHDFFTANRIGPYTQTAPLKLYQGDADTTVLRQSTDALVAALRAGGNSVDYEVVPGGTHTNVAFGFVAYQELRTTESIAWLRARLAE
ncbi:MAG: hypothetical protein IT370_31970 [Deltaproteobacteria bacterium]|nr:hypothetical protein [Deltaproteobacteria bacterium]